MALYFLINAILVNVNSWGGLDSHITHRNHVVNLGDA